MSNEKPKEKGRFSKFVVTLIVLANILFTGAVLYIFLRVQSEPTTLIVSWFAFTTGELGALAGIKAKKIAGSINKSVNKDAN